MGAELISVKRSLEYMCDLLGKFLVACKLYIFYFGIGVGVSE